MSALPLDEDDLRMQIFCRTVVEAGGETYNVVAFLNAYKPGLVFVGVNDDNDYPDERYPVTSVDMPIAQKFRSQHGEYPWEMLMREAEQTLLEPEHG